MATNPLKIGVSGVRGVVGETFTPELAVRLASAFATYTGEGEVLICDDARPSGRMVRSAVISALISSGCSPCDLGICPVPTLQYEIAKSGAAGGIAISGGHNPEDWNALRFIRSDGMYFNDLQGEEVLDVFHQGEFTKAAWNELKPLKKHQNPGAAHIGAILESVDRKKIRKAGFRVAMDTCNGACSIPARELLESLGCGIVALNDDPGEPFPHDPEPSEANMRQLAAVVAATGFDIGFMFDSAGERLALVTGKGISLPEENTLTLCTSMKLRKKPGTVVTNICTTRAIDDIAAKYKSKVIRTPVGQSFVAEAAAKTGAVIAGEGSGGVINPDVHISFDSLAAMAFILEGLAISGDSLSSAAAALPKYVMIKKTVKFDYTAIYKVIRNTRRQLKRETGGARIDLSDGIKVEWNDSWLHIRPSNTEPLIRIIAEAKKASRAEELINLGKEILSK